MRTRPANTLFVVSLAAQIAFKLWLVHGHEIVACDYPHDDPWYVVASTNWYWWGSYAAGGFSRPPGYPLWIALSRSLGLPLRVSTELLLFAAASAFAISLVRAGVSRFAAAFVFGLVILNPYTVYVNDSIMADALYGPLLLFSIAGMVALVARPWHWQIMVWSGLALGVLWHTRHESPLIVGYVGLFVLVAAWVRWGQGRGAEEIARELGVTVFVMWVVISGISLVVRTMNYASFGSFADHELAIPGFAELNRALLRIVPAHRVCQVPVPQESLRRAYAVSPTLRTLQPYLDGEDGNRWRALGPRHVAVQHELVGGLVPSTLIAAIHWAGHNKSASDAEVFCRRAAEEIDAACVSGQLHCTSDLFGPLVLVRDCFANLPASFSALAEPFVAPEPVFEPRCRARVNQSVVLDVLDFAVNRRAGLVTRIFRVAGWAVSFADPVHVVSFRDVRGQTVAFTDQLRARPDLDAAFGSRQPPGSGPLLASFELPIPLRADHPGGGQLVFRLRSGTAIEITEDEMRGIELAHPSRIGVDGGLEYAIEYRGTMPEEGGAADLVLSGLLQWYGPGVFVLTCAGVVSLLVVALGRGYRSCRVLCGIVGLLLGLAVLRVALFVLLDAMVWTSNDVRYLYPVVAVYPSSMVVLVSCAARRVAQMLRRPNPEQQTHRERIDKRN